MNGGGEVTVTRGNRVRAMQHAIAKLRDGRVDRVKLDTLFDSSLEQCWWTWLEGEWVSE